MHLGVSAAILGHEIVPGDVEIQDGLIAGVGLTPASNSLIAVPGFVDVHVHGHDGVDFASASQDDHGAAARKIVATGVTSYNPTLMSMPMDDLMAAAARHPGVVPEGARVLGFHLEGPFLSPAKAGAHRPDVLVEPTPERIDQILSAGSVGHLTIAPELPGAESAISRLVDAGVVVSLGHSVASAEVTHAAVDLGATSFTHVFNAMAPLKHRDPGMVGVALSRNDVFVTAIFDGVHLSDEAALLLISAAGNRLVAITDGTAGVGAATHNPAAPRLSDGTLAGSALTMDQAFRNLAALGLDLPGCVRATAANPAKLARRPELGRIQPGSPADIAVLDDGYKVVRTLVAGTEVFRV